MYGPTNLPKGGAFRRVTVPEIRDRKTQGPSIAMVTAYDFTMARLLDEAGVDIALVGDSLGMVVQGLANTLPVTLGEICYQKAEHLETNWQDADTAAYWSKIAQKLHSIKA